MLSSLLKGRDANGYPIEDIDVEPERKVKPLYKNEEDFHAGKIEYSLARLVELLQEANKRAKEWEENVETLNRKYNNLHADYIALKYSNLCGECQKVKGSTPSGKTYTLCETCARGKETIESLRIELERAQQKIRYRQECYETALTQITDDVVDTKNDR